MWMILLLLFPSFVLAADIAPTGFTATWDVPADQTVQYEFRVSNFALPAPLSLGVRPSMPNSLTFTFTSPLPNVPDTGRWECLDVRAVKNGVAGPWLSETPRGAACGQVGLSATPVPTPIPVPTPMPIPEIFYNLTNSTGVLTFTYKNTVCPKGTSKATSALKLDGSRTVTMKCLK